MPASRAQQTQTAERRRNAVALRLAGADWDTIKDRLGYASRGAACTDVKRALEASRALMHESVAQHRHVAGLRLDRLLMVVFPMALRGDLKSLEQARGIIADQRKLFGTDAPTKHQVVSIGAVEAAIAELEAQLGANDPAGVLPDALDRAAPPPA